MTKQRTIVLTGATRGCGRALAEEFARGGHTVLGCGRGAVQIGELQKALGEPHDFATVNVADAEAVAWWAKRVLKRYGAPDLVVNNAALINKNAPLWQVPAAEMDALLAVNVSGTANVVRSFVPAMIERGAGVIVNMSSIARHGNRGQSNYVAAKAALAANTKTWAAEFARYGIRVGAISPGMVKTPMTDGMNTKALEALTAAIPVGRIGLPEDIWLAVRFVIECEYFNARTIDVDGGLSF